MISYVLDNLTLRPCDYIFIIYYNQFDTSHQDTLRKKHNNLHFIKLNKQTKGAAETILMGVRDIITMTNHKKTMLFDCDAFYTEDVVSLYRNESTNAVFFIKNDEKNPIYSYVTLEQSSNRVIKIAEKTKISDNANTGIYCFQDIQELYYFAEKVVYENIMFRDEYYTSCIIDQMLMKEHIFKGIELMPCHVFNIGTPSQVDLYIKNTSIFLFDLDGTLVISDDIYYEIWHELLSEYKIELTPDIFKQGICGNCDSSVIRSLIPSCYQDINILTISNKKDVMFIEKINKLRIIDGAIAFLSQIKQKGHKIAIVTNCNRGAAEAIIDHIGISKYLDFIVIGNECERSKPYPDPYLKAIQHFNSTPCKTIIFEDSKSGILSASGVNPNCIVGIETIYNNKELVKHGCSMSISNYIGLEPERFIKYQRINIIENIKKYIRESVSNIRNIEIGDQKLKGGFISDVISVILYMNDGSVNNCVLKLENKEDNFLSNMSASLMLYEREYYFYESVSKYVPIKTPDFFGLIRDENFNNIGILMRALTPDDGYILNLDLNKQPIETSLNIIDSLAKMHAKFWNKNLSGVFYNLKKHDDPAFFPQFPRFLSNRWDLFKTKWVNVLTNEQLLLGEDIVNNFPTIQHLMSDKNLTLCHGDVKSANIFYKMVESNKYEPWFIDWQYVIHGKGVQDLVFLMIESFDIETIKQYRTLFTEYYYIKLCDYGVTDYTRDEYVVDFKNASYYFPFFVAVWFGTINEDELIDKNFPFFLYNDCLRFTPSKIIQISIKRYVTGTL